MLLYLLPAFMFLNFCMLLFYADALFLILFSISQNKNWFYKVNGLHYEQIIEFHLFNKILLIISFLWEFLRFYIKNGKQPLCFANFISLMLEDVQSGLNFWNREECIPVLLTKVKTC